MGTSYYFHIGDVIECFLNKYKVLDQLLNNNSKQYYRVSYEDKQYQLIWLERQKSNIFVQEYYEKFKIVREWNPSQFPGFILPEDMTALNNDGYGVVFPLYPQSYYPLEDILIGKQSFSSYKTIVDCALSIIKSFRLLHSRGYTFYSDYYGMIHVDPVNGRVLIEGSFIAPDGFSAGISLRFGYIAPEVISGQAPDSYSDRWAMVVILFMLFTNTKPLEGRRTLNNRLRTHSFLRKIYEVDPHFIMEDIKHPEYGPDPDIQSNVISLWDSFPYYLKDLFLKSFSRESVEKSYTRPSELDWINCLVRFRSEIIQCECGSEMIFNEGQKIVCNKCGSNIDIPFKLTFKKSNYSLPCVPDTRVYACQICGYNVENPLSPIAKIVINSNNPTMKALRNLSGKGWIGKTRSGTEKTVPDRYVVPILQGIKIYIESEEIAIEENKQD